MSADLFKAVATYTVSGIVIIGGLLIVYQTRLETTADELRLLIAGFIGASLAFLHNQEVQTRTARQTASATAAGQNAAPTITTTAGPPATATITPAPPTADTAP